MSSRRRRRSAARGRGASGRRAEAVAGARDGERGVAAGSDGARMRLDRHAGRSQRDEARRRSRQQRQLRRAALWSLAIVGVAAIIIASGLWLWRETADAIESQPGTSVPDLGNLHITEGTRSPTAYNSTPPTSGPHYPFLARWGVHTEPLPDELQVHNLEDGGVVIQYRCDEPCPELVEQLTAAGQPYLSSPHPYVVLAPYPEMENRIALTAWGRIDRFEEFDEERIRRFIEVYRCTDWHEGQFRGRRRVPNC